MINWAVSALSGVLLEKAKLYNLLRNEKIIVCVLTVSRKPEMIYHVIYSRCLGYIAQTQRTMKIGTSAKQPACERLIFIKDPLWPSFRAHVGIQQAVS